MWLTCVGEALMVSCQRLIDQAHLTWRFSASGCLGYQLQAGARDTLRVIFDGVRRVRGDGVRDPALTIC
jgi:hypothetical protein